MQVPAAQPPGLRRGQVQTRPTTRLPGCVGGIRWQSPGPLPGQACTSPAFGRRWITTRATRVPWVVIRTSMRSPARRPLTCKASQSAPRTGSRLEGHGDHVPRPGYPPSWYAGRPPISRQTPTRPWPTSYLTRVTAIKATSGTATSSTTRTTR